MPDETTTPGEARPGAGGGAHPRADTPAWHLYNEAALIDGIADAVDLRQFDRIAAARVYGIAGRLRMLAGAIAAPTAPTAPAAGAAEEAPSDAEWADALKALTTHAAEVEFRQWRGDPEEHVEGAREQHRRARATVLVLRDRERRAPAPADARARADALELPEPISPLGEAAYTGAPTKKWIAERTMYAKGFNDCLAQVRSRLAARRAAGEGRA